MEAVGIPMVDFTADVDAYFSKKPRLALRVFNILVMAALVVIPAIFFKGAGISFGAVTAFWYGLAVKDQWGATAADRIDWVTDTIKMSLHTNTYTPNQDTDDYFNDCTNELATAGGYTANGATLGTKTLTYDATSNTVRFKAADVTWTSATFTARKAVIYKSTGTASTSHVMGYIEFGADQSPSGVDFTVKGDATDGFLRGVVS